MKYHRKKSWSTKYTSVLNKRPNFKFLEQIIKTFLSKSSEIFRDCLFVSRLILISGIVWFLSQPLVDMCKPWPSTRTRQPKKTRIGRFLSRSFHIQRTGIHLAWPGRFRATVRACGLGGSWRHLLSCYSAVVMSVE